MVIGDYPIDFTVTGARDQDTGRWTGGPPPPGHYRRCQAQAYTTQSQCAHWALRGAFYCEYHGGRQGLLSRRPRNTYAKFATDKLKDLLDEQNQLSPEERLTLINEIDVARALASAAVKMMSVACFPDEGSVKISDETKCLAVQTCQHSMEQVTKIIERHHKILAMRSMVDKSVVQYVINKIVRILDEVLMPEHEDLYTRLNTLLDELEIPTDDTKAAVTLSIS